MLNVPKSQCEVIRFDGKRPDTVLVLERQLFNYALREYDTDLSYTRFW